MRISTSRPELDLGDGGSCGMTAILRRLADGSREDTKGLLGVGCRSVLMALSRAAAEAYSVVLESWFESDDMEGPGSDVDGRR
jgi:hypothetical protein